MPKLAARLVISFLLLIGLFACQPSSKPEKPLNSPSQQTIEFDRLFTQFDDINKPGASVAVLQDGEIIFSKGYGSANLEYDIPVTPETMFHVASVSKQFTVFAILLLAEEGKLNFDDDIRQYIPEVPDFGHTITLRHLASHTSGMRDQWNLLRMAGWRLDDVITTEHVLKIVARQKELNFEPGEEFLYSNTGFTLLAEVVARVSGKSFAQFTQERLFTPLNMSNSLFYDDHQKIVSNRAYSYERNGNGYKKSVLNYSNVGATSLFTTAEDLLKWSANFSEPTVGSPAIVKQMNTLASLNNGETFGGAYGQFISHYKGTKYIQHSGGDAGFRSYLARFPKQNLAIAILNNGADARPWELAMQIADRLLKQDNPPPQNAIANAFLESISPKQISDSIELDEETLNAYVGHYWHEPETYSREIYLKNGKLMYSRGKDDVSELAPISENTFKMLNVEGEIYVEFTKSDGKNLMTVRVDNVDTYVSVAYTPVKITKTWLSQYAGSYFSPELSSTYHLSPENKQLKISHHRLSDHYIAPVKDDFFSSQVGDILFERDGHGEVNGFRISNGRVRNLYFRKL
ncbi:class A beta-lactamase-related serine hydrolase [Alteromonas sp. BL110]|uniref:serine hydrolase domain-containing protein n=1 Tax=Alteromonas sp. BL110 TaxID=1714845 RepID=UPI000E5403E6|nr:serine hydrolase domain-containing protein [Alteromonas sp. BL110]AXT39908.1 class A beta-lactamase-related serine hydrolase [Alteromonas sp. BL110]RKM79137.1 class A beta-lactamase-related serine hydrolase [Alteromonas sp. BL110]